MTEIRITPMPAGITEAIMAIVRGAAGEEFCHAIDESRREFHAVWESMSDEERARWVIGEES